MKKVSRYKCKWFYVDDGDGFASCDRRGNDKGTCDEYECPIRNQRIF